MSLIPEDERNMVRQSARDVRRRETIRQIRQLAATLEMGGNEDTIYQLYDLVNSLMGPPAKTRLPELFEGGDIATVKAAIRAKYGFEPTDDYCRDLIDFVQELTHA